jgi:hypothetical protein
MKSIAILFGSVSLALLACSAAPSATSSNEAQTANDKPAPSVTDVLSGMSAGLFVPTTLAKSGDAFFVGKDANTKDCVAEIGVGYDKNGAVDGIYVGIGDFEIEPSDTFSGAQFDFQSNVQPEHILGFTKSDTGFTADWGFTSIDATAGLNNRWHDHIAVTRDDKKILSIAIQDDDTYLGSNTTETRAKACSDLSLVIALTNEAGQAIATKAKDQHNAKAAADDKVDTIDYNGGCQLVAKDKLECAFPMVPVGADQNADDDRDAPQPVLNVTLRIADGAVAEIVKTETGSID